VFPSGPLRAPLHQQLVRAQVLIVVGDIVLAESTIAIAKAHGLAVFCARLKPDPEAVRLLTGAPVLAFAGIGHPDKFFTTLLEAGIRLGLTRGFADHHGYTPAQADRLVAEAERHGWTLVTTEKDLVRLRDDPRLASLAQRARALPVRLMLNREQDFEALLRSALNAHRRTPLPDRP
jgi:tetraacyldisaccharide 4'-kinase